MESLRSQIRWCDRLQVALTAFAIIVALLFYLFIYRPHNQQMAQLGGEIGDMQQELRASQSLAGHLPEVTRDINNLREALEDFKMLPNKSDLGDFMTQITQLSREGELRKFQVTAPSTPKHHDQFTEQQVALRFEGDFLSVFSFLRQAEDMKRLTRVSDIAIRNADLSTGTVTVDVSLSLYYSEG